MSQLLIISEEDNVRLMVTFNYSLILTNNFTEWWSQILSDITTLAKCETLDLIPVEERNLEIASKFIHPYCYKAITVYLSVEKCLNIT